MLTRKNWLSHHTSRIHENQQGHQSKIMKGVDTNVMYSLLFCPKDVHSASVCYNWDVQDSHICIQQVWVAIGTDKALTFAFSKCGLQLGRARRYYTLRLCHCDIMIYYLLCQWKSRASHFIFFIFLYKIASFIRNILKYT